MTIKLAFRLYGDFQWPPTEIQEDDDTNLRRGVVDIFFVEENINDVTHHALLRWRSSEQFDNNDVLSPPDDNHNVYNKNLNLQDIFFNSASPVCIWISRRTLENPKNGIKLRFRGACVFEQYTQENQVLEIRWPLVRQYSYDKLDTRSKQVHYAELIVGQDARNPKENNSNFRFNLALPTPVAQTSNKNYKTLSVLAFSSVHPSDTRNDKIYGAVGILTAGAVGRNGPESFEVKDIPSGFRLGERGFAVNAGSSKKFISITKGTAHDPDYWPVGSHKVVLDLLNRLGLDTQFILSLKDAYEVNPENPDQLSISFFKNKEDIFGFGIDYRISLKVKGRPKIQQGPIRIINGIFHLNLPSRRGQLLSLNQEIMAILKLRWAISDEILSSWLSEGASGEYKSELDSSLLWSETIPETQEHKIIKDIIEAIDKIHSGLVAVSSEQPQSFLPAISSIKSKSDQKIAFKLIKNQTTELNSSIGSIQDWSNEQFEADLRFELASAEDYTHDKSSVKPLHLKAQFINFDKRRVMPSLVLKLEPFSTEKSDFSDIDPSLFAIFKITADASPEKPENPPIIGRLGALIFESENNWLEDSKEPNCLKVWYKQLDSASQIKSSAVDLELNLRLGIKMVSPVTVDIARGERDRKSTPLLIPEASSIEFSSTNPDTTREAAPSNFLLKVTERTGDQQDWVLTAELLDSSSGANALNSESYIVLNDEPFTLFRFARLPLAASGDAGDAGIATYNSDMRTWLFKKSSQYYHYVLPTQAIGESTDKPRRLEIIDLDESFDGENFVRPYPVDDEGNPVPLKTYQVEYRLTPSTELWIKPSDLERGYFLPEWAAHDIFRQRGDFGFGAKLAALRGEFLYGLSVSVDTAKEVGIARHSRIAEIETLVGKMPNKPKSESGNKDLKDRWSEIRQSLKSRPERLEIWSLDQDNKHPFSPARFNSGLRFVLRQSALHQFPILLDEENTRSHASTNNLRFHKQGLSGGALWPLEFRTAFESLLKKPDADSGVLEKIALSPIGADADQKASFLKGILSISSETRSGFVQRQRIEILGRIGAHWHRAKHVVVYERTVNPSAQFAPELENGGWHKKRTRRPVLRKICEYIELLQPLRKYPDTDTDPRTCGFLEAIRYNTTIINVDSAWGSDITNIGYVIPLWNRLSAKKRPQVYPKPDVVFITRAEGAEEFAHCAQECDDPENIYFFTDLNSNESDTDQWPAYIGIDGAEVLDPSSMLATQKEKNADNSSGNEPAFDNRIPSTSRFMPGTRRFTWRLLPSASKSQINAHRGEKPIYAEVESISLIRAVPKADETIAEQQRGVLTALSKFSNSNIPVWDETGLAAGSDPILQLANSHRALMQATNMDEAKRLITECMEQLKASDNHPVWSQIDALTAIKLPLTLDCESLSREAMDGITRKRILIRENLGAWQEDVKNKLNTLLKIPAVNTPIDSYKDSIKKRILASLQGYLSPAFEQAYAAADRVESDIEQARYIITQAQSDITQGLQKALIRVDALAASYHDNKPWSTNRLQEFSLKIRIELDALYGEAKTAVDETGERLSLELSNWNHGLAAQLTRAMFESIHKLYVLEKFVTGSPNPTSILCAPIRAIIDRFIVANGYLGKIDTLISDINQETRNQYQDKLEPIKSLINTGRDKASILKTNLDAIEKLSLENNDSFVKILLQNLNALREGINGIGNFSINLIEEIEQIGIDIIEQSVASSIKQLHGIMVEVNHHLETWSGWPTNQLEHIDQWIDPTMTALRQYIQLLIRETHELLAVGMQKADEWTRNIKDSITELKSELEPSELLTKHVLHPFVDHLTNNIPLNTYQKVIDGQDIQCLKNEMISRLAGAADAITGTGNFLDSAAKKVIENTAVQTACKSLSKSYETAIKFGTVELKKKIKDQLDQYGALEELHDINEVIEEAGKIGNKLKGWVEEIGTTAEQAKAYGRRALEAASNIGHGDAKTVPGNILRLYSAVTSAPKLDLLEANIDRLRCGFNEISEIIDTTEARVTFARLGDALKSLGLNIPFNGLSDTFKIDDEALRKLELSRIFRNFGGLKLDGLFKGVTIPNDIKNAVRVSHDFNKQQARASVQIDVNVPISGRRELFAFGPFAMYFRDSNLVARVKLEASKDEQEVKESGFARIVTSIDSVASGQPLITLEKAEISYSQESGLRFDLNPQNIKLNDVFRFIQDTFSGIFPDEVGGLTVIKENNIPIGVEHDFSLPNLSLSFGTSGVSNIQINNRFRLVAVPDFIIANRFNLSTPELPFLFSIFIIGGTGYIQVDIEYRPFDQRLMVVVEAAAGGSGALGFAFGPVNGSVFITLSVALSYRKLIGSEGGGLSVGLVLVIAGYVSLWNMVRVYLGLMLRLSYRDNGQIDGQGDLRVEVRVSRFFKLRYRTTVTYQLRGGKSTTTRNSTTSIESKKLNEIRDKVQRLNQARS